MLRDTVSMSRLPLRLSSPSRTARTKPGAIKMVAGGGGAEMGDAEWFGAWIKSKVSSPKSKVSSPARAAGVTVGGGVVRVGGVGGGRVHVQQ